MIRTLTIAVALGGILGCLFIMGFVDLDAHARATHAVALALFLLVLTLTPRAES